MEPHAYATPSTQIRPSESGGTKGLHNATCVGSDHPAGTSTRTVSLGRQPPRSRGSMRSTWPCRAARIKAVWPVRCTHNNPTTNQSRLLRVQHARYPGSEILDTPNHTTTQRHGTAAVQHNAHKTNVCNPTLRSSTQQGVHNFQVSTAAGVQQRSHTIVLQHTSSVGSDTGVGRCTRRRTAARTRFNPI